MIAADASSEGIGAVLLQIQDDGRRRPVCYASRSLTDTEKRYAVTEKEALAATWTYEKETLMSASFPSRPWERVGVDLFELHGKVYIVVDDY